MTNVRIDEHGTSKLLESLHSPRAVTGLTHNFYRYPARMSPELARQIIEQFSQRDQLVLDPFMGGGTSIVEALAAGRRAIGIDLNPIAAFVTAAKTTPLSSNDKRALLRWASEIELGTGASDMVPTLPESLAEARIKNLPVPIVDAFARALPSVASLPFPRQRHFARCSLLRLGQWAVDCKSAFPDASAMRAKLRSYVGEMLSGLDELAFAAGKHQIKKSGITGRRTLLLRSAVGVDEDRRLEREKGVPILVVTSPPYPGVHVLYHRWQVAGRRETPAPYWLIGATDGHGASHYTLGSRSMLGLDNYFRTLVDAYRSLRAILHPQALVVQLVAFSDLTSQLPAYLRAMESAGYREDSPRALDRAMLWRDVPNREWYYRVGAVKGTARELLLFHRPCTDGTAISSECVRAITQLACGGGS